MRKNCVGVKKLNCLRLKVFEFDLINHLESLFQMNQGGNERFIPKRCISDSCSLFLISLQASKLMTKKAKIKSQSPDGH